MALNQNWSSLSRGLSQSYTELTNEMDLDEFDYGDADDISWVDADKIKWESSGTRNLSINYNDVSRNLSQNWTEVSR